MRFRTGSLALGCVALAVLIAAGAAARLMRPNPEVPTWANEYDLATAPENIAPGTVVENAPPDGWSHLVIKSLPRVRPSEVDRVPSARLAPRAITVRMVSWMFTVFAADVVREQHGGQPRYRLRAIGLGLGAKATDGRDTVVTSATAKQFGVELDVFTIRQQILDTGYRIQERAVVPVHGPSFALLDTPVISRCGDRHRSVRYRYALLVDPRTGRLDVVLWLLGGEGGECADLTRAVLLEPNCIDEAELVPDPAEFGDLRPSDLAFAVDKLPPYRVDMPIPAGLRALAGRTRFAPADARALEDGLREMTAGPRP